ncbi:MAG TPA: RDD family protein, partial [Jatrophihabitantaceae bacterium]
MTASSNLPARWSQGRELQGREAGLVSRFAAAAVDLVVVILLLGVIYAVSAGFAFLIDPRNFQWPARIGWTIPVAGLGVAAPYLTLAWCTAGRTLGNVLFGLRVVNRRGGRLRLPRALLRALFCLVFPLGLFWIPFSASRRSIQDVVLRTSVTYDWAQHHHPAS